MMGASHTHATKEGPETFDKKKQLVSSSTDCCTRRLSFVDGLHRNTTVVPLDHYSTVGDDTHDTAKQKTKTYQLLGGVL